MKKKDNSFDKLEMYVIYDHPKDFPVNFVVRCWIVDEGKVKAKKRAHAIVESLKEARKSIPFGFIPIMRDSDDDPTIVEVWL